MPRNKDFLGALVFFFVGAFAAFEGYRLDPGTVLNPGAGFFAFYLGIILSLLSIPLFFKGVRASLAGDRNPVGRPGRWKRLLFAVVLFVSYAFTLKSLGFVMCSFVSLILLLRVVEGRSWRSTLIISMVCTVVSYFVFAKYLGVPLPKGVLPY